MFRVAVLLSFLLLSSFAGAALRAQEDPRAQFRAEFTKGVEYNDAKMMDKAIKKDGGPAQAWLYFEELYVEKWRAQPGADSATVAARDAKLTGLRESWARCFEGSHSLEKIQRWIDGMDENLYAKLQKERAESAKLWQFAQTIMQGQVKSEYQKVVEQFTQLARNAETLGHAIEAADLWGLAAVVANRTPDKTVEDRDQTVFLTEQFLLQRDAWEFTGDGVYITSREFAKAEKVRLEEAKKKADARQAAGYDANAKGIDSLVMPNVTEAKSELSFEALKTWENELDYGPKNGPQPALWWNASLKGDGSNTQLNWFRRTQLYMLRTGNTKFAIGTDPGEPAKAEEIDVSGKAKPTTFHLDAAKKEPYAMFFWAGSDRERVGEAECNLAFTTEMANVYFRSAASWKATVAGDAVVFYDDNASGTPCDGDPFDPPFKVHTLGDHGGEGTVVPLLDSMRVGKGPRVPFSEFVKFASGWHYLHRDGNATVGTKPLNPEFFKTGKVKLDWSGVKSGAPAQLVIQGSSDYKSAFFDIAGGKEVEVPAGEYAVIFGRIVAGKGARSQTATLYRGSSPTFLVEPDKTTVVKMGAPYELQFARRGDENTSIDALSIMLKEASGCLITELQNGCSFVPEVFAAKSEDGKGAKVVGKFVRFTDGDLLNEAAKKHGNLGLLCATFPMPAGYRNGELILELKLPAAGMKVGLKIKKHPLFGAIESAWR
ncbi:MAG: hypothetical protein KDC48_13375 [Planctomycetes bacterium]|nr:hypothetical protein [Planctomycetota bacterium]